MMKTDKLIKEFFAPQSVGTTEKLIGLAAGLAAGVVLGVLFAPGSGRSLRERIITAATELIKGKVEEELAVETETSVQGTKKKPKSDIKELIHQAHVAASHTEQEII